MSIAIDFEKYGRWIFLRNFDLNLNFIYRYNYVKNKIVSPSQIFDMYFYTPT